MKQEQIQRGMTLIELMIALAIFMIITAALFSLYIDSNRNYSEDEVFARMQENGRFALKMIAQDLQLAGYWGEMTDPSIIGDNTGYTWNTNDCSLDLETPRYKDNSNPANNIQVIKRYAEGDAALSAGTCSSLMGTIKANTSAIGIKRVSSVATAVADQTAGDIYLRTNGFDGNFHKSDGTALPAGYQDWRYKPVLYFLKDDTSGIPFLCKSDLVISGGNPTLESIGNAEDDCFAEGVSFMHIEYGIDTDSPTDGIVDQYTTTTTENAITARVYLLVRSAVQSPDVDYLNNKTYTLGMRAALGPFNDRYFRRVYSTTVQLRNPRTLVLFGY